MLFLPRAMPFPQLAAHLPLLPFEDLTWTLPPTSDENCLDTSSFPIELTTVNPLNPADTVTYLQFFLTLVYVSVSLYQALSILKEDIVSIQKIS